MAKYEIVQGNTCIAYTNTFPARRYKYRLDKVKVGDKILEGSIQVRTRNGRTDCLTSFRNWCVVGVDPEWLIRQNLGSVLTE
jgi:hypothetical protein